MTGAAGEFDGQGKRAGAETVATSALGSATESAVVPVAASAMSGIRRAESDGVVTADGQAFGTLAPASKVSQPIPIDPARKMASTDDPFWKAKADAAMVRYATGDNGAFSALYDILAPRLYAYLTRHLPGAAKDVLQQTFLRLHAARGRFDPGGSAVAYTFAIARALRIDFARRWRPEVPLPDEDAAGLAEVWLAENNVEETIDLQTAGRILESELRRCSPRQRQLYELVQRDGLSHAEAAEVFGITAEAVKQCTKRIKARLEAALNVAVQNDPRSGR